MLLNEIGPQNGTTRLYDSGHFFLDVTGAYTINVQIFKRPAGVPGATSHDSQGRADGAPLIVRRTASTRR